jgi:L-fucose mutarotase/ribose pyranase (RbsD/FucU family)
MARVPVDGVLMVTGERRLYGNLIVRKGNIPPAPDHPEAPR